MLVPNWQLSLLKAIELARPNALALLQSRLVERYTDSQCNATQGCDLRFGKCLNTSGLPVYQCACLMAELPSRATPNTSATEHPVVSMLLALTADWCVCSCAAQTTRTVRVSATTGLWAATARSLTCQATSAT